MTKKYYEAIYRNSTVIHLSKSLLNDVEDIRTIKHKFVIGNGIKAIPEKFESSSQIKFLYLSNFFASKGAMELLKGFEILDAKYENISLTMVGGWPDSNFKKELEAYHSLVPWKNKVEIIGPCYGNEKENFFRKSDILVFPSLYELECFPLVILEAMSCGLAIVASTVGAIPEILDNGKVGVLVESVNPQSIAYAMERLILDKEKIALLGKSAKEKFNTNYTESVFEKNMGKCYFKVGRIIVIEVSFNLNLLLDKRHC